MIVNNVKLIMLLFILTVCQFILNNVFNLYVDMIGVLLVVCMLYSTLNLSYIIGIALIADLFGYWYIGEHLVAIMLLSIIAIKIEHFFKISSFILKLLIVELFVFGQTLMVIVLNHLFNNHNNFTLSYLLQFIVLVPAIQFSYEKLVPIKPRDMVWYD